MQQNPSHELPRYGGGMNWKHWLAIGLVVVLCCGGWLVSSLDFSNPTGHIQSNYERAANLDEGRGRAYTSSLPPASVANSIDDADGARKQRRDGNKHFLQYKSHIVSVEPHRGGSKILLFNYRDGYRHYSPVFIGWGWSSSPLPPFRGGGPGSGK
ncbi:DUF4247 domain-containing protein [Glycomyces xiaoerkulensis]|uniref:DUF4247 domain-containing protein n=1 Tax=Glycomyces xiaoerkulensis TaxID=2038139 RepID=UPI000C266615|nr:DUF4247 domain-containing protein [Glycomyces xiaoerkulensis]